MTMSTHSQPTVNRFADPGALQGAACVARVGRDCAWLLDGFAGLAGHVVGHTRKPMTRISRLGKKKEGDSNEATIRSGRRSPTI